MRFQDHLAPAMLWFFDCGVVQKAINDALQAAMNAPQPKLKESEKLTMIHLLGPILLHILIMALATLVWIGELCLGAFKRRKDRVTKMNQHKYPFLE